MVVCPLHLGTTYALSREAIMTLRACLEASEAMSTPAHAEEHFVALLITSCSWDQAHHWFVLNARVESDMNQ